MISSESAIRLNLVSDAETNKLRPKSKTDDQWFYPIEIAGDLRDAAIPAKYIPETLSTAWEYTRVVIPHFSNYPRYIAFCRLIIIAVLAEFKGSIATSKEPVFGYELEALLHIVFHGTVYDEDMRREFRCFLTFVTMKSSKRRNSQLFKEYADSLAHSPETWFRLRDCDALLRFTIGGALACNDIDGTWFTETELQLFSEIGVTMYDAVAYYKHRAEGEIHSSFAYFSKSLREESYRYCREILWALDVAWANIPCHRFIVNLLRNFGGPLHMMTRRYVFVEDGLTLGQPETKERVLKVRENEKLWYRVESLQNETEPKEEKTVQELDRLQFFFPGLSKILVDSKINRCDSCVYPDFYGTIHLEQFSSVQLCDRCRSSWDMYLEKLPTRAANTFKCIQAVPNFKLACDWSSCNKDF